MDDDVANGLFSKAALMLETGAHDSDARALLGALGFLDASPEKKAASAKLLRFANDNCEVFAVEDHRNSSLCFLGAVPSLEGAAKLGGIPVQSFSGAGRSLGDAFGACIGEAGEFFSHQLRSLEHSNAVARRIPAASSYGAHVDDWIEAAPFDVGREVGCVNAFSLTSGDAVAVPASLLLRVGCNPDKGRDWFGWGNGCASGATSESALHSGLCEVVERDAIAMWWDGGRPAGRLNTATVYEACVGVRVFMDAIHADRERTLRLFDITTEFAIPCVAAVSSAADGRRAVFGFGCHSSFEKACTSALRELNQMEIGRCVLQFKQKLQLQQGVDGEVHLSPWETVLQARLSGLDVRETPAFQHAKPSVPPFLQTQSEDRSSYWAERFKRLGHDVLYLDLTQPTFQVPVAKLLIPGLQPYPSRYVSKRLRNQRLQAGMGALGKQEWEIL